jgi:hypothetical protein
MPFEQKPPVWYWIVSALFLVWGLMGCFSLYLFVTVGPTMNPDPGEWDRAYAAAIRAGMCGSMWSRSARDAGGAGAAGPLALRPASVHCFDYRGGDPVRLCLPRDRPDRAQGAAATIPFPLVIFVIAAVELWFAGVAQRRGWLS